METNLRWHIGKEGGLGTRLDTPPFRAYFYWVEDGMLHRADDYSESELSAEVERRRKGGENVEQYEAALSRLKRANGK